jgi:hypothetical protein
VEAVTSKLMHDFRWAIYIDIEGFSTLYDRENQVLLALGDLMEGIFLIGARCYPESPERIFAHQTGDGFVIVSEFGSESLEVPVSIAIALLRHIAARGRFGKAAIGEGDFADITGCYPQIVREALIGDSSVRMGGSIMTLFPVMGTALIDAVGVEKRSPSGALLTTSSDNQSRMPSSCVMTELHGARVISIDWVHSDLPLVTALQKYAGLGKPSATAIERAFNLYCDNQQPPEHWVESTARFLGFARSKGGI